MSEFALNAIRENQHGNHRLARRRDHRNFLVRPSYPPVSFGGVRFVVTLLLLHVEFVCAGLGQSLVSTNGLIAHFPFHNGARNESKVADNAILMRANWAADRRGSLDSRALYFRPGPPMVLDSPRGDHSSMGFPLTISGPAVTNVSTFFRYYGRRFTLSAWLKPDEGCDGILMQSKVGNLSIKRTTNGWNVALSTFSDRPGLGVTDSEFATISKQAGAPGPWHQLALVEDKEGSLTNKTLPGSLKLFVDGRLAKSVLISTNVLGLSSEWHRGTNESFWAFFGSAAWPNSVISPDPGPIPPGAPTEPAWDTVSPAYAGLMDDLRIYDRALADAEVKALYESERTLAIMSRVVPELTAGRVRLLTGIRPGSEFRLESSTNLIQWGPQETTLLPREEGLGMEIATRDPKRFFRIRDIRESATDKPIIVTQPVRSVGIIGQDLSLEVKVSGETPMSYQWIRVPATGIFAGKLGYGVPIAGATGAKLRFPNAERADTGLYCVAVSNRFSTNLTYSSIVRLDIGLPPKILSGPADVDVMYKTDPSNRKLWLSPPTFTKGNSRSLQVSATGDAPLGHEWWEGPSTGEIWNPQRNGQPGDVMWTYHQDAGPFTVSTSYMNPEVAYLNNGSCWAVVTNLFGRATTDVAVLRFFAQPRILSESPDLSVPKGGSVKLLVDVFGTPKFFARWYRNGVELPSDIDNPVTPVESTTGHMAWVVPWTKSGSYHAVVCNAWGCITSRTIKVAGP